MDAILNEEPRSHEAAVDFTVHPLKSDTPLAIDLPDESLVKLQNIGPSQEIAKIAKRDSEIAKIAR